VLRKLPEEALYRRDLLLGEIIGSAGKREWTEVSADRIRLLVDSHVKLAKWVTTRNNKQHVLVYRACNRDQAGLVVAAAQSAPSVRDLHLMVSYPIYGPGFARIQPGWNDGLYYDEPEDLRDLGARTDCELIRNVLHDLVVDFPFKTQADRENFFGLLLTPIIAPAIEGNRPMHLLNSPLERTGKSKLVNEVMGGIIAGKDTPSMQITEREEEREKRILAVLLQGETLMHLDNLPPYVDSPALASLLTTKDFQGRVLGISRNVSLPNNLTIIGTGNNVQASGEIAKRIVPIMIEPTSANPEARTDFQHPDIRAYVRQQRRTVLECLLGMVANWLASGRPRHANRLGGFENWSEIIGGILQSNGLRQWRTNEAEWRERANPGGSEMDAFVRAWHTAYGSQEVVPQVLRELARQCNVFGQVFAKRSDPAVNVAFGRMLSRHIDTPVASWHIRRTGASNHACYHLEEIN
jgi:DNA polymerase-1